MDIIQIITRELKVEKWQVEAAVKLIDEGCTIPFISRYRKEATGSLNDEQLRTLHERLTYLRNLEDKKNQVLGSIEEQGKLTPELKKQILDAQTLVVVEDLYRPYRPKRRTRAIIAKEKGLEPLANIIMLQMTNKSLEEEAKAFLSEEKGVETIEDAINGAKDILAEHISDEADYRIYLRKLTMDKGTVVSAAKNPEESSVYEMYYEFEEPIKKLAGHRVLALNRGEKEKMLTVKISAPEDEAMGWLQKQVITRDNPVTKPVLREVVEDSYKRLIAPAIEREIRSDLTEKAEDGAVSDELLAMFDKRRQQFIDAMSDDLNTADAIAALFELVRDINSNVIAANANKGSVEEAIKVFDELAGVLGLVYDRKKDSLDDEIEALIEQRTQARKDRNWAEADRIRDELKAKGIVLEDTAQGVKWHRE